MGGDFFTCGHPRTSLAPGIQDPLHANDHKIERSRDSGQNDDLYADYQDFEQL